MDQDTLQLFITTVGSVLMAWIAVKQRVLQRDVKHLEVNTNSIKDALVLAARAEGNLAGRLEAKEEADKIKAEALNVKNV